MSKMVSKIIDQKINAFNILIELKIQDYLKIANTVIQENPYQRKRVSATSAKTVYGLLKEDLKNGCIIPPIVLAKQTNHNIDYFLEKSDEELISSLSHGKLIILDGLQRTFTLHDAAKELELEVLESAKNGNPENSAVYRYTAFMNRPIRIEIYLGINRTGILYRMLTLNTGQTPMSLRHQIEILYSEYSEHTIKDITLLRDYSTNKKSALGAYKFHEVIDGFLSYLTGDEQSVDRQDLLNDIRNIENLVTGVDSDSFIEFLTTYHEFIKRIVAISEGFSIEGIEKANLEGIFRTSPFGDNAEEIFTSPQVITGFGAAIRKLIDFGAIGSIKDLQNSMQDLRLDAKPKDVFLPLLIHLEFIRTSAPKIGNYQRLFFKHFFRVLFDKNESSYMNIFKSVDASYRRYQRDI